MGYYLILTPFGYYLCASLVSTPTTDVQSWKLWFLRRPWTEPAELLQFLSFVHSRGPHFVLKVAAEPVDPSGRNDSSPAEAIRGRLLVHLNGRAPSFFSLNGARLDVRAPLDNSVWLVDFAVGGGPPAALKLGAADACEREAQALLQLGHLPHVPRLVWAGPTDCKNESEAWAVITRPVGSPLLLDRPFGGDVLMQLTRDLFETLAGLASLDMRHRDISPYNIVLVNGRAQLIDYGFASVGPCEELEQAGTVTYMSIRTHRLRLIGYVRGMVSSAWEDLESLLYVCWRLHLGRRPWPSASWKRNSLSPDGSSDTSSDVTERAVLLAKEQWLSQTTATTLPAPLDRIRELTGRRVLASPPQEASPPPFAELLSLVAG
jgi:serine/threonine protein kinase